MRNLMKIVAVVLFVAVAATAGAQTLKFGHIDMQALIQVMPERATAETEFNTFQGELEDILGDMQKELTTKMTEFEGMGESVSEIKRNAKVTEIQDLQQRIQNYQVTAQQQLQQKQSDLLQPVFDKAEKAIADVAKENGLIYVFDIGPKVVLYQSAQSMDVLPMVKAKLGIQ